LKPGIGKAAQRCVIVERRANPRAANTFVAEYGDDVTQQRTIKTLSTILRQRYAFPDVGFVRLKLDLAFLFANVFGALRDPAVGGDFFRALIGRVRIARKNPLGKTAPPAPKSLAHGVIVVPTARDRQRVNGFRVDLAESRDDARRNAGRGLAQLHRPQQAAVKHPPPLR